MKFKFIYILSITFISFSFSQTKIDLKIVKPGEPNSIAITDALGNVSWAKIQNIDSYANLVAYDKPFNTIFLNTKYDKGTFDYQPAFPAKVIDNGLVFPATGKGGGYWQRKIENGIIDATMFGATPDDEIDDATGFQNMFNSPYLSQNINIRLTFGAYNINSRVTCIDKYVMNFDGNYSTIKIGPINNVDPAQGTCFYLGRGGATSYDKKTSIKNLYFDFQNQNTNCNAIFFGNLQKELSLEYVHVNNFGSNGQCGLYLYGVGDDVGNSFGVGRGATIRYCSFKGDSNNGTCDYNNPTQKGVAIVITGSQSLGVETVSEFGAIEGCTFWAIYKAVKFIEGANWTFNSNNLIAFCNPIVAGNVNNGIVEVLSGSVSNNGKLSVIGNQFKHNQGYCIYSNYNNALRPVIIQSNQFISNDYTTIFLDSIGFNSIQNNVFQNWKNAFTLNHLNKPFSENSTNVPAIKIKNSSTNSVTNNNFQGGGNFIDISNVNSSTFSHNIFKDGGIGVVMNNVTFSYVIDNVTSDVTELTSILGSTAGGGNTIKRISNTLDIIEFSTTIPTTTIQKNKEKTLFYQTGSTTANGGIITLPADAIMGETLQIFFSGFAASNAVSMSTPYVVSSSVTFQGSGSDIILKNYDENQPVYFGDVFTFTKVNPDKWAKSVQHAFNPSYKFLQNGVNAETMRFDGTSWVSSDILRNNGNDLFFKNKVTQGTILTGLTTENSIVTNNPYALGLYRDLAGSSASILSFGAKNASNLPFTTSEIWGQTIDENNGRLHIATRKSGTMNFSASFLENGSIRHNFYTNASSFSVVGTHLGIYDNSGLIGTNGFDYIYKKTEMATVATSGNFNDLTNISNIAKKDAINNYSATQNFDGIVNLNGPTNVQQPIVNSNPTPKSYVDQAIADSKWDVDEKIISIVSNIPVGSVFTSNVSGAAASNIQVTSRVAGDNYARMVCGTGTTTTGRAGLLTSTNTMLFEAGKTYVYDIRRFRIPTALTASVSIFLGFGDGSIAEPVDGAYFKINDLSTNITCVTSSNSVRTNSGAGTFTFAVNTDYDLRIVATSTGIAFYINDMVTPKFVSTTNIPNVFGREFGINAIVVATAGTVSKSFQIDDIKFKVY